MKKIFYLLTALTVLTVSCSIFSGTDQSGNTDRRKYEGLTYDTAAQLSPDSKQKEYRSEKAWLEAHYPGCTVDKQNLVNREKKVFDVLEVALKNGERITVYFDMTEILAKR